MVTTSAMVGPGGRSWFRVAIDPQRLPHGGVITDDGHAPVATDGRTLRVPKVPRRTHVGTPKLDRNLLTFAGTDTVSLRLSRDGPYWRSLPGVLLSLP